MVERIKDEQDRLLESMFESAPIADDGFSERILRQVRRRLWVRRVTLPSAILLGGLIAYQPASSLAKGVLKLLASWPGDLTSSVIGNLPSLQLVVTGGLILLVALLSLNMLEE